LSGCWGVRSDLVNGMPPLPSGIVPDHDLPLPKPACDKVAVAPGPKRPGADPVHRARASHIHRADPRSLLWLRQDTNHCAEVRLLGHRRRSDLSWLWRRWGRLPYRLDPAPDHRVQHAIRRELEITDPARSAHSACPRGGGGSRDDRSSPVSMWAMPPRQPV
jgi:hypothetical protein